MQLPAIPDLPRSRRSFLAASLSSCTAAAAWSAKLSGSEPPQVRRPRATDGDERHEPDWEERLTLTVGPDQADLVGRSDRVLQAACDSLARRGGGTVKILPGTYTLRNAVWLPANVRLLGSGPETVLTKPASVTAPLTADSDWYDQEITLADASGFQVGDGVTLQCKNPHNGGVTVIKRTLIARSGNRFKLNDGLRENLWLSGEPSCSTLFPLLTSEYTSDVVIENLTLDGNKDNNANLNGNYGGCVFLQDCQRYTIRNVEARNYNGDGISFQICHDVVVENCHCHDNAQLGLHPGSGSQRPLIRHNTLERNSLGLFWCWGVKFGLAEGNRIRDNRDYGVSIGHNDTDNVMRDNDITGSGKVGVLFRDEVRGQDFWPNRNTLENNRIIDSGGESGIAIDIQGQTKDVRLVRNEIRESRGAKNRVAIRISPAAGAVQLEGNLISGFSRDILDQRAARGG